MKEFPNSTKYEETYSNDSRFGVGFVNEAENTLVNYTYNTAEWLGFYKTNEENSLPHLVRWNIIYILTITLWAVVKIRQFNFRVSNGKPISRPYFLFPSIKRSDADKNLKNCFKYLMNFAFYKFGVEVSEKTLYI